MRKFFLLIFIVGIFTSCKKKDNLLGEFLLGDLIITNPYNGNETLIYQTNEKEIIQFHGEGRIRYTEDINPDDIRDEYYILEHDICSFISENEDYKLIIALHTNYVSPNYSLSLHIHDHISYIYNYYLSWGSFILPLLNTNLKPEQKYFDSLYIHNKFFLNVFADTLFTLGSNSVKIKNDTVHPVKIYYNMSHGILKVNFTDSTSWELKEIIY